jgi:hypothetical protein
MHRPPPFFRDDLFDVLPSVNDCERRGLSRYLVKLGNHFKVTPAAFFPGFLRRYLSEVFEQPGHQAPGRSSAKVFNLL